MLTPTSADATGWSPCPLTVRLEPMPFYVADWQVEMQLRHCGEVVQVRFQRGGQGAAIVRFCHPAATEMALRQGEVNMLGQRCFVIAAWCESRFHLWPGNCSATEDGGRQRHGQPPVEQHVVDGVGDWKCNRCGNLNFSHRVRCNRCHAELRLSSAGLALRPSPNRCPYTVMVSPADRSKGGLQAGDYAVLEAMRAYGEVIKITSFTSRPSGLGAHKFCRFRDPSAALAALHSSELHILGEAAVIRPAYQRRASPPVSNTNAACHNPNGGTALPSQFPQMLGTPISGFALSPGAMSGAPVNGAPAEGHFGLRVYGEAGSFMPGAMNGSMDGWLHLPAQGDLSNGAAPVAHGAAASSSPGGAVVEVSSLGAPVLSLAMMSLGAPPPPPPLSSASQTANGVVETHVNRRGHCADSCSAAPSPADGNSGVTGGEAVAGTAARSSGLAAASSLAGLHATTSSTLPLPPLPSTLPGSGTGQLSPSATATHPSNAASNLSATGRAISFLLVAEEEATRAPARVRRIVNATSLDAVQAELRLSLGLPADSQLMYFSTGTFA